MSETLIKLLREFYECKKYGEIIVKIEGGKIVRYEKKESIKVIIYPNTGGTIEKTYGRRKG